MSFACELISTQEEPVSEPVAYEAVGSTLDGIPIEAGFGATSWRWSVMPQADFDRLLDTQGDAPGTAMLVRTAKRNGASGIDFANYNCIVGRPVFQTRERLVCYEVTMPIFQMVVV